MKRLIQFETRLEGLVERLFGHRMDAEAVLRAVARAVEAELVMAEDGRQIAPGHIALYMNSQDYTQLLSNQPYIEEELVNYVVELAQKWHVVLEQLPLVTLTPSDTQAIGRIQIKVSVPTPSKVSTQPLHVEADLTHKAPPQAQLMRDNALLHSLDSQVVNIGRHVSNHIILDDVRISRHHCQIRLRHGRYVIYDLNSTHGTFVNDAVILEHILENADVISLGGVRLLYLEDDSTDQLRNTEGDTAIQQASSPTHSSAD